VPPTGQFSVTAVEQPLDDSAARLARHTGLTIDGVRLAYQGPKQFIHVQWEVWEKGRLKFEEGGSHDRLEKASNYYLVTLGERRLQEGEEGDIEVSVVYPDGGSMHTSMPLPVLEELNKQGYYAFQPLSINRPTTVSDDKRPVVCGFFWSQDTNRKPNESLRDYAKRVKAAVLFRVGFEN
jgi:hypothetical protein